MKALLILLLSIASLLGYSQTKEYYKLNGEIKPATRGVNDIKYLCKHFGRLSKINNINNKLSWTPPLKKDGSELTADVLTLVVLEDPEIFSKISAKVLKKYGFEVYTNKEWFEDKSVDKSNSFMLFTYYDSSNGKILEVGFMFTARENRYASYLPIEAYAEIEKQVKKQTKATITEEGRTRIFCSHFVRVGFKPKK